VSSFRPPTLEEALAAREREDEALFVQFLATDGSPLVGDFEPHCSPTLMFVDTDRADRERLELS
jgi:hypothetical protein